MYRRSVYVDLKLSEIRGGAGREGRTASAFAAEGECPLSAAHAQNNSNGDGWGPDLERLVTGSASKAIQTRSSGSWKTCTKVSKERERDRD